MDSDATRTTIVPDPDQVAGDFLIAADEYIATIRVQIGTGDIVRQHTPAIVNPANSHLNHFGGVARIIADAAGNDLVNECETYKQTHGLLPLSSVIHTTAGKLPDWNTVRSQSPTLKAYWHQWESLKLADGILYRQLEPAHTADAPVKQLLLPRALRTDFLDSVHTGLAGHMGMTKTAAHVTRRAYWFQWRRDVNLYVRRCPKCSTYHRGRVPPRQANLVPLLTGAPVERWAIDLAGPFPKSSKGHVYIMTAIDVFSKYIILVPLRDKKAITVAHAIYERVFLKYGAGEILTDNGGEFRNELLSELCTLMGVSRSFTTAYHARCNAVCERQFHASEMHRQQPT